MADGSCVAMIAVTPSMIRPSSVTNRRAPARSRPTVGDEDQHRQGLRENPLAVIEAQAEPDGHQGGAHGRQELEDQPGEQGDTQGRQRGRMHFFARGGHGPLVVPGPPESPQQRQALDQCVEAVTEALKAGQPAADHGRGVRPDQPGQYRGDHQRHARQAGRDQVEMADPGQQQRRNGYGQDSAGQDSAHEGIEVVDPVSDQCRQATRPRSVVLLIGGQAGRPRPADGRR
jgi:hypothetical protein